MSVTLKKIYPKTYRCD